MKVTSVVFAALFAGAIAAPGKDKDYDPKKWGKDQKYDDKKWDGNWDDKRDDRWGKKKCDKDMKCKGKKGCPQGDKKFTSVYYVEAFPDQVVNVTVPTGGLPGSYSSWDMGFNSDDDFVCWYIVSKGFRGEYESAARTATHVHEGPPGVAGPPRLSLKNPVGRGDVRISSGCQKGPYTTGLDDEETGIDTGVGFTAGELEDSPEEYYVDIHSSLAVPGANRGQFPGY